MSYLITHTNNTEFIKEHYKLQIEAFTLLQKDSLFSSIPNNKIKFGGGTALAIYYFQHRLSFDIDLFVEDMQYLDYIRPKMWIDDTSNFNPCEYIDSYNHIGLVSKNEIKIDILIDANSNKGLIDNSKEIFPFELYIESIEDILSKKITFRKKDNKARDIFDIAVAIDNNKNILKNMLHLKKITKDDLIELKTSLENLNLNKYNLQIKIVNPFDKYKEVANKAKLIIINNINSII